MYNIVQVYTDIWLCNIYYIIVILSRYLIKKNVYFNWPFVAKLRNEQNLILKLQIITNLFHPLYHDSCRPVVLFNVYWWYIYSKPNLDTSYQYLMQRIYCKLVQQDEEDFWNESDLQKSRRMFLFVCAA